MGYKLLEGIRVLDLTMVFAGPMGSRMLTDLGAEVIKIESASRSDVFTRANVYPENEPGEEPWNRGCFFHSVNAGKYGVSLNLGSEDGREIFKRLVKISDIKTNLACNVPKFRFGEHLQNFMIFQFRLVYYKIYDFRFIWSFCCNSRLKLF